MRDHTWSSSDLPSTAKHSSWLLSASASLLFHNIPGPLPTLATVNNRGNISRAKRVRRLLLATNIGGGGEAEECRRRNIHGRDWGTSRTRRLRSTCHKPLQQIAHRLRLLLPQDLNTRFLILPGRAPNLRDRARPVLLGQRLMGVMAEFPMGSLWRRRVLGELLVDCPLNQLRKLPLEGLMSTAF